MTALSDVELERGLRILLGENARTEAGIVAHLAEVESRRIHLRAGYPSMFQYCLEHLGLSENEAFHRIVAARLAATYPLIFELLEARKLHLSGVCLLRRHLTPENHSELLAESCGKSKRQVEELLARRFPTSVDSKARTARFKPVSADCYRLEIYVTKTQKEKLELARDLVSHANPSGDWGFVVERAAEALVERAQGRRFAKTKTKTRGGGGRSDARENVERANASAAHAKNAEDVHAKNAEDARARDVCAKDVCARDVCEEHAHTHDARPAEEVGPLKPSGRRHIPNRVRRLVAIRDEMSCTFTSETGKRCGARGFLQFDHRRAWAHGGRETCENLRILCAGHNRLLAEQEFGAPAVSRGIQRQRNEAGALKAGMSGESPGSAPTAGAILGPGKVPKSAA